jgi:hypothetical protein
MTQPDKLISTNEPKTRAKELRKSELKAIKNPLGSQSLPHFYILLYNRFQYLNAKAARDAGQHKARVISFQRFA